MKLVLLDLDKTLIDSSYSLTESESEFRRIVLELGEKGVRVGLCSDSALLSLRQWAERLGLTGPVIAERGALVWDPILNIQEIVNPNATDWLQNLRGAFLGAAILRFPETTVVVEDATEFVRHRITFTSMTQKVLVVNSFRVASFSFFARRFSGEGVIERDPGFLREAAALTEELLVSFGRQKEDLFWDESPEYCILIVHARNSEKRHGVTHIVRRYHPEQIVMIGDSVADYLDLPDVAQYAVGNASTEYKGKCTFVAERHYTGGVIEGLRRMM